MAKENPLVSILIPNYNKAQYLDACITSGLNQTYKNVEIIVFDDSSTDNSLEVLAKHVPRITVLHDTETKHHKHGFCQQIAYRKAFEASSGDVISFLDSDDIIAEDKIEKIVAAFGTDDTILTVMNGGAQVDDAMNEIAPIGFRPLKYKTHREHYYGENEIYTPMAPTSFESFRRELFDMYPFFKVDNYLRTYIDIRIPKIAALLGEVVYIREPLTYRRVGSGHHDTETGNLEILLRRWEHHQFMNEYLEASGEKKLAFWKSRHFRILVFKLFYVPVEPYMPQWVRNRFKKTIKI